MPTYEFQCNKCNEKFERFLSIKDRESSKILCPKCRSEDVSQVFNALNIKSGSGGSSGTDGAGSGRGCSGYCGSCSGCRDK